ncbi:transposase family protein [Nostoc sp.]|uniref:transposase family protein n=1 Tax=Nostoc sp. TaxID=1180 RepID=UPI003FA5B223
MLNSILVAAFPLKKYRGADLSTPECYHNRNLARLTVVSEHINRRLKIFRIFKEQYRNRRRCFALLCNWIA